jgi:hypothetical protein
MRIAICLSGLPRCWDRHPNNLLKLFPGHDVDVFQHHWDDHIDDKIKNSIKNSWKPVKIKFEKQPEDIFQDLRSKSRHLSFGRLNVNTFPMWMSIWSSDKLRREHEITTGIKYDSVLRSRTDHWTDGDWLKGFDKILENQNNLVLPTKNHYEGYCDQIALGSSYSMSVYANLWLWIPEAIKLERKVAYEIMLKDYLDNFTKLKIYQEKINFKMMRPYHPKVNNWDQALDGSASVPPKNFEI